MKIQKVQRILTALLLLCFLLGMLIGMSLVSDVDLSNILPVQPKARYHPDTGTGSQLIAKLQPRDREEIKTLGAVSSTTALPTQQKLDSKLEDFTTNDTQHIAVSYNLHVFYYPWYRTADYDGMYYHWNHRYLPHWEAREASRWPSGHHRPPDDIGANFYPQLGPYSSRDPQIIAAHMKQIRNAGIGRY